MLKHHPKLKKIVKDKGIKSREFTDELCKVVVASVKRGNQKKINNLLNEAIKHYFNN